MDGFWTDLRKQAAFEKETGLDFGEIIRISGEFNRAWAFGGWGWELTELLGHFFSAQLSFELRPPASDLSTKAKQAIFWHHFENVRASSCSDLSENIGHDGTTLYHGTFYPIKRELITLMDWRSVWDTIETGVCGIHKSRIEWLTLEGIGKGGVSPDDALWECIHSNLYMTIVCAVGYLIAKSDKESFKPLLKLFMSGNLPIGFDQDNVLVVLCKP